MAAVVGNPGYIVHGDIKKFCDLYQGRYGNAGPSGFIVGNGLLLHINVHAQFFLADMLFFPQFADPYLI